MGRVLSWSKRQFWNFRLRGVGKSELGTKDSSAASHKRPWHRTLSGSWLWMLRECWKPRDSGPGQHYGARGQTCSMCSTKTQQTRAEGTEAMWSFPTCCPACTSLPAQALHWPQRGLWSWWSWCCLTAARKHRHSQCSTVWGLQMEEFVFWVSSAGHWEMIWVNAINPTGGQAKKQARLELASSICFKGQPVPLLYCHILPISTLTMS